MYLVVNPQNHLGLRRGPTHHRQYHHHHHHHHHSHHSHLVSQMIVDGWKGRVIEIITRQSFVRDSELNGDHHLVHHNLTTLSASRTVGK